MKLLIIAALFIAAHAQNCSQVYFRNRYYKLELLKEGLNNVQDLKLNPNDNTLYFIYDQLSEWPNKALGYFNIDNKETGLIEGVRNATSIAIDKDYNRVYVGGSDGIYRINDKRIPEILSIRDSIHSMFFKNALYYTNKIKKQAYIYENNYINPIYELHGVEAENIILDDDNNIFFTQGKTLFRVKMGTKAINPHEQYRVDVLATDAYFKPYIGTKEGVYVYNKYKYVFDKVSSILYLKALTFSKNDEPIFCVFDKLIRLTTNSDVCLQL